MARDRGPRDRNDRKSWSEIDKNRGKKKDSASAPTPDPRPVDRYQQKVRDEKFDSLFVDSKKTAGLKKIRENVGKDGFGAAVDEHRAAYGLPSEFDLLQLVLENHGDPAVRVEALEAMDKSVDGTADSTKLVFKTRVKLLALTSRELPLKKAAARIAKARGF